MRGQALAFGLARGVSVCSGARHLARRFQRCELGLKVRLVGSKSFLKQLALLSIHAFGLGSKLPGLEAAQLKGDAGDLGISELNSLGLRFDLPALLTNVCQHAGGQFGSGGRAQTNKILGLKLIYAEHVCIVQDPNKKEN